MTNPTDTAHPVTSTTITTSTPATAVASAVTTEVTTTKPGYKTTEFWLSSIAALFGMLYASGVITPDGTSTVAKAIALIVAALATAGYSVSRGNAKAA